MCRSRFPLNGNKFFKSQELCMIDLGSEFFCVHSWKTIYRSLPRLAGLDAFSATTPLRPGWQQFCGSLAQCSPYTPLSHRSAKY